MDVCAAARGVVARKGPVAETAIETAGRMEELTWKKFNRQKWRRSAETPLQCDGQVTRRWPMPC